MATLGEAAKAARLEAKLGLEKAAARAGTSVSTIRRTEQGVQFPGIDRMACIAAAYGKNLPDLLADVDFTELIAQAS